MVLPIDFKLHENRLSKESKESILFQYERLDLDSTISSIFIDKYLRISKSPALPPDDPEIIYLASKVAYIRSKYDYFAENEEKIKNHNGALVWYALAKAAIGLIDESMELLGHVLSEIDGTDDPLVYIECLGVYAQILFIRGSDYRKRFEEIIGLIKKFKEQHEEELTDFDEMFLPSYLILERQKTMQLTPDEAIKPIEDLYKLTKSTGNNYFRMQAQLDLIYAYINNNLLDKSKELLDNIFVDLTTFKFNSLAAKAQRFLGFWYETKGEFDLAEKTYTTAKDQYITLNDQIGVSSCILHLAKLFEKQEMQEKSEELYKESYKLSEKLHDHLGMTVSMTALAQFAARRGKYKHALRNYTTVLNIAEENNFDKLLPSIYDGFSHINFMAGDFKSAVENRTNSLNYKLKFDYDISEILIDHIKLGQLNAIIGEFKTAFSEFEDALNICNKLNQKDDIYFDILNWLFDISYVLGKTALAESYIGRADLFASIHNSKEEGVQAIISRIRFHIQKRELETAQELLVNVFDQAQNFPSPLTMALALVEKSVVLLLEYIESKDATVFEAILNSIDDMLFISLDLEFLPLTMYTKKVLGKVMAFKEEYDEGIEELDEAINLANDLGMLSFAQNLKEDRKDIEKQKESNGNLQEEELEKLKDQYLEDALAYLRETFWLVSASEYQ